MKYLIFILLLMFSGCETFNAVQIAAKPENAKESVIYMYGQIKAIRNAAAIVGSDPALLEDDANKALMLYVADKLTAPMLKVTSDILLAFRNKEITYAEAINTIRPDVDGDELSSVHTNHEAIHILHYTTKDWIQKYDQIQNITDIKTCSLVIGKTSLPCTSAGDQIFAVWLAYQKNK